MPEAIEEVELLFVALVEEALERAGPLRYWSQHRSLFLVADDDSALDQPLYRATFAQLANYRG